MTVPMLDLPLHELKTYTSISPKPTSFEAFWQAAVQAIHEPIHFTRKKKTSLNPHVHCEELVFKSHDQHNVYVKYVRPVTNESVPVVLLFHDYQKSSPSWFQLHRYAALNMAVLAMDCRGQGGQTPDLVAGLGSTVSGHLIKGLDDQPLNFYYTKVYLDGVVLSKLVSQLDGLDANQLMTIGTGQGASLAAVVAALNPHIKKCCLKDLFLADFYRIWQQDADVLFYEGLRYYFRWFDPLHEKEQEIFDKLGYIDVVNFAPLIKAEVLLGTGLLNQTCLPSTQFAFINALQTSKTHKIYPKHAHELNNHFEDECLKFLVK